MTARTNTDGFSLIEVLAALLIFSLAIIGLTAAGSESSRSVTAMNEKMLAGIVADNVLTQARYEPVRIGGRRGSENQMGRDFEWDLETQTTEADGFYQFIVNVNLENSDQVLVQRTAYLREKAPELFEAQPAQPQNPDPDNTEEE